jgi:NAD(P)-dependent dehydrogenase (short-subunit alcohol dehydrogenase family)
MSTAERPLEGRPLEGRPLEGRPLEGKVALVAGATRGAGRGIAVELGAAGAHVYATGRSTAAKPSEYGRSETIEETADLVRAEGGTATAVAVDHLDPAQVQALVERIERDSGRLDVLVNDIWGGELLFEWDIPMWEHSLENGLHLLHLAVDTHLITSHAALPLLVRRPGGLVVEVTDGTAEYNATNYRVSLFYDLAKSSVLRLAWSQGHELAPHGCTALAITPGWMRSEMMLEHYSVTEENWREVLDRPHEEPYPDPGHFGISETPRFTGRAVAVLAADPDVARWNQASLSAGQLAREYGFVDLDGSSPDAWRYIVEVQDAGKAPDPERYR